MRLLKENELPPGFRYPASFLRLVRLGLLQLEPWWILDGDELRRTLEGLRTRYPVRTLVPFARRQDNDDIACFAANEVGKVVIIHDFASPGWELEGEFQTVYAWLKEAIENLIDFDQ